MGPRMTLHGRVASGPLVALLLAATLSLVGAGVSAAATPSESILLYSPGKARTGVLTDTRFVRKATFSITGVTGAAASRTSLAMYNRATGKLRTGTFRGGIYKRVETITIRSGFTHVAASCDSLLLYSSVSGRILTGTLIGGKFRNRTTRFIAPGWMDVAASCDTAWFVRTDTSDSVHELGVLVGGDYTKTQDDTDGPRFEIAMTDTSWIALEGKGLGDWGPVSQGERTFFADYLTTFYPGQRMAGTATHVLFYTPATSASCVWRLVGRAWSQGPCDQTLASGITVMAGGR